MVNPQRRHLIMRPYQNLFWIENALASRKSSEVLPVPGARTAPLAVHHRYPQLQHSGKENPVARVLTLP
jgi:hypothetical protein